MAKDNNLNFGLNTDCSPNEQVAGTYRFALNAIEETVDGNQRKISNEPSNFDSSAFTEGFFPIGDIYIGNDTSGVISTNPLTGKTEIGIIDKDNKYYMYVSTSVLGISIANQCDIKFRLRRGNERVIYWVDGVNVIRTFNFDKPYNFYNNAYKNYLQAGNNPNTYPYEKWDRGSFDLIKSYNSIPNFDNIEVVEVGNIIPGSYNFTIQMVDEDLNPSAWITTSNTVNIYNDSTNNAYETIRGSKNVHTDAQNFTRANKSIKLTLSNLDTTFPYYRIGIIRAVGGTGEPTDVLVSDLYSTANRNFTYTGNDGNLKTTAIGDILIDREVIFAPRHIEQLENRLIVAYTEGKNLNLCDFQKFASKIKTDVAYKQVVLNNIQSEPNVKNAKSTFMFGGYMPGEVYSLGIAYIFPDYITPSYHIAGKNASDTISKFVYHEIDDKYLDIHNCSSNNYWGVDAKGQTLVGKKIRHHRFPFRKDVNKPLVTTTSEVTNVTKYKLTLTFSLNPAWTPGPPSYPTDSGTPPLPLVIDYVINYQKTGGTGTNNYTSQLVDTDVSGAVQIVIYDEVTSLDLISGKHYQLDPTCELATYQVVGNERFIITETYASYIASSSINNDVAEIFGIEFSNIEKPHPDCIGFFITRNERTEDDKTIVDNAILGSMTQFEQYRTFGLLAPKQYYIANNCGKTDNPNKTLQYYDKGIWFFNPEFQYLQKKPEFDSVVIEGTYTETSQNMPTISNINGSTCNNGGSRGLYIQDVQAGTSYNPELNKKKDKDDDGFDLIVGYRNINVAFSLNSTGIQIPVKLRIMYLSAATYQNFQNDTYYNVSIDNKIGMYITNDVIDQTYLRNNGANTNKWLYGALVKNSTSSYSNFLVRQYFKEHNNPILFGTLNVMNGVKIFNGDADISAMHLVSSVYYDIVAASRDKKSKVWAIVAGAVLVIAGVVATIMTAGAAAPTIAIGVATLSGLAISYGVSLAVSGIKFEQMKAMIDEDYEKGLKNTIEDGGVYETIRPNLSNEDDTFRWFADRISNLYIESSVPFGLRSGLTSGVPDFIDAPSAYNEERFRGQLREKLTVLDREQGSGRLYKGYATAEFYDINKDYLRFNKEKIFIHLPIEYDCCSVGKKELYPTRRWFSQQSFQEELTDNYGVFLPNNYNDMEGETGEITDLARLGNNLYVFTREGVWQQPANMQERVTDEIVSFIGTGDFLAIPPRKVLDSGVSVGGTQHKWATIKTPFGIFYISEIEGKPYILGETAKDISEGNVSYFEENIKSFLVTQLYNKYRVVFLHDNNPANLNGVGYLSNFDTRYKRIVFTKRDYLILPEKLNTLVIKSTRPIAGEDFAYCLEDGIFYNGIVPISLNNTLFFEDKSFTMSFSIRSGRWVSWHSYIPNYYIYTQNSFYYCIYTSSKIWKHYKEGSYTIFNNIAYPFILEYIKTNDYQDMILNDILLQTIARKWNSAMKEYIEDKFITFNKIIVSNNRQCTGELIMVVKDTQSSPQDWYSQQTKNSAGTILITKKEGNWNINEFRDYVNDYTKPIFTRSWNDIKGNYFIDKVVNNSIINQNKNWYELESFTGQFISIRLKFDTFNDVNLIMNYSVEFEQPSFR